MQNQALCLERVSKSDVTEEDEAQARIMQNQFTEILGVRSFAVSTHVFPSQWVVTFCQASKPASKLCMLTSPYTWPLKAQAEHVHFELLSRCPLELAATYALCRMWEF